MKKIIIHLLVLVLSIPIGYLLKDITPLIFLFLLFSSAIILLSVFIALHVESDKWKELLFILVFIIFSLYFSMQFHQRDNKRKRVTLDKLLIELNEFKVANNYYPLKIDTIKINGFLYSIEADSLNFSFSCDLDSRNTMHYNSKDSSWLEMGF